MQKLVVSKIKKWFYFDAYFSKIYIRKILRKSYGSPVEIRTPAYPVATSNIPEVSDGKKSLSILFIKFAEMQTYSPAP